MHRILLRILASMAAALVTISLAVAADTGTPSTAPRPNDAQACAGAAAPAERAKACATLLANPAIRPADAAIDHYFRGFALKDLGQADAALADFNEALRLDAGLWPTYWVRAEILAARRDYEKAADDLTGLIVRNPQIASLYSMRGGALDNQGQASAAVGDYTRSIELAAPKDPLAEFYMNRAVAFEGAHQLDKSLADFSEAIRRDEHLSLAYAGRGRAEFLTGDFAAASADLTRAADADPANLYSDLWLFLAQSRAGTDAVGELKRRAGKTDLKRWPGPIVQILLGNLGPDQFETPALPATWPEAARKAGANCEVSFYLGEFNFAKGRRDKAAALFRAAVRTGIQEYIEYRAAAFELDRMAP